MTASEMLDYYKDKVFGAIGIDIEGLQHKDEAYQKWARVSVADQLLAMDAKGDYARELALQFYDKCLQPVKENPLMQEPQEGLSQWIVKLMRLLAYLLDTDLHFTPIDLNWLDDRFKPMEGDGYDQFSPSNRELLQYLTAYSRVGAKLAQRVFDQAGYEADKIDSPLFDYYIYCRNRDRFDLTDEMSCLEYIHRLHDAISDVEFHLSRGKKLGLTKEEIGLVDSLWTEIPHTYPEEYVAAAKEIWPKVKKVVDNFADGRKMMSDERLFERDMLKKILPITEKYEIDMELDDDYSLPLACLKDWLMNIYQGEDTIIYGR